MEANIYVAIAILYADNQVANNRHARAITKELLLCRLCTILLCLYELMVELNIIHLILFQLARCKYTIEQLNNKVLRVSAVLKSQVFPISDVYEMFSCVNSFIALRIVLELQVRSVG